MHTHSLGPPVSDQKDGYVHDPAAFDGDGEPTGESEQAGPDQDDSWLEEPVHPESVDREFGTRGWILVGVIFVAFIVAPGLILVIPPGTDYLFALLIVPLIPAVVLGLTAVWATTRP